MLNAGEGKAQSWTGDEFNASSLDTTNWIVRGVNDGYGQTKFGLAPSFPQPGSSGFARFKLDSYNPNSTYAGNYFYGTNIQSVARFPDGDSLALNSGYEIEARLRVSQTRSGIVNAFWEHWQTAGTTPVRDENDWELLSKQGVLSNWKEVHPAVFNNYPNDGSDATKSQSWQPTVNLAGFDWRNWNSYKIRWQRLNDGTYRTQWLVKINEADPYTLLHTALSTTSPVPDQGMNVRFNIWVPSADMNWDDAYDSNFQPVNTNTSEEYYMDVDYVRVYSVAPTTDTTNPSVAITTPADGAAVTALSAVRGTVQDEETGSGVKRVSLRITHDVNGSLQYWNGSSWTTTNSSITTDISGNDWSRTTTLPSGANLPDGSYQVVAHAYDYAGDPNRYSSATNNFVVGATPTPTPTSTPTPTPTPAGTYSISGRVANNSGAGLNGIQITRNGSSSVFTDANGYYTFSGVTPGTYTIAPVINSAFDNSYPTSSSVTVSTANLTNINFSAWFRIGGRITNHSNIPMVNMQVARSNSDRTSVISTYTDANGNYVFHDVRSGIYHLEPYVTPALAGMTFTPTPDITLTVGTQNFTNQNFIVMFTVSGIVTDSATGAALANVDMQLASGASIIHQSTGTDGKYIFSYVHSGSYTLTAHAAGKIFYPASKTVDVSTGNITNQNFFGSDTSGGGSAMADGGTSDNTVTELDGGETAINEEWQGPPAEPSPVVLASVSANGQSVQLVFTGALDAADTVDAIHYALEGAQGFVEIMNPVYDATNYTVTFTVPTGALASGAMFTAYASGLMDAHGKPLNPQAVQFTVP